MTSFFFSLLGSSALAEWIKPASLALLPSTALPGFLIAILRGEKQPVSSAEWRDGSGSHLSACPLSCDPLQQPLLQPLLWQYCREEAGKHHKHIWPNGAEHMPLLQAEEDPENKGEGWFDAAAWVMAVGRGMYPLPSWLRMVRIPCDFGGKWTWLYPVVINDSLALFAATTS